MHLGAKYISTPLANCCTTVFWLTRDKMFHALCVTVCWLDFSCRTSAVRTFRAAREWCWYQRQIVGSQAGNEPEKTREIFICTHTSLWQEENRESHYSHVGGNSLVCQPWFSVRVRDVDFSTTRCVLAWLKNSLCYLPLSRRVTRVVVWRMARPLGKTMCS